MFLKSINFTIHKECTSDSNCPQLCISNYKFMHISFELVYEIHSNYHSPYVASIHGHQRFFFELVYEIHSNYHSPYVASIHGHQRFFCGGISQVYHFKVLK